MASFLQLAWRFHLPNTQHFCAYWRYATCSFSPGRHVALQSAFPPPRPSSSRGPTWIEPCGYPVALHIVQYVKLGRENIPGIWRARRVPRGADISPSSIPYHQHFIMINSRAARTRRDCPRSASEPRRGRGRLRRPGQKLKDQCWDRDPVVSGNAYYCTIILHFTRPRPRLARQTPAEEAEPSRWPYRTLLDAHANSFDHIRTIQ